MGTKINNLSAFEAHDLPIGLLRCLPVGVVIKIIMSRLVNRNDFLPEDSEVRSIRLPCMMKGILWTLDQDSKHAKSVILALM